jgi:hypothetical protein
MDRWSQIVRTRGAVEIQGHHAVDVPPLGEEYPHPLQRVGVRLLVRPIGGLPATPAIDVTSSAVIAMLEAFLHSGTHIGKRLDWKATGFGVRRRDTLHIRPLDTP